MRDLHVERRELSGEIVEVWTIDREEVRNALSRSLVRAIGEAARRVETDREVRGVVLTGRGDRSFCAGADLKERRGMSEAEVRDFLAMYRTEFRFLDRLSKPVVAAIQGVAFGGGFQIMLGADMRYIHPETKLSIMEIRWGLVPDMAGTVLMRRLARDDVLRELTYTGRVFSGEEALAYGFATRVCPDPYEAAHATARVMKLAAC